MGVFFDAVMESMKNDLIEELNTEFLLDSIKSQLKNPLSENIKIDCYKSFNKKYKKNIEDATDSAREVLDEERDRFTSTITKLVSDKYKLDIYSDDSSNDYSIAKHLYRFFVADLRENLIEFFISYILKERKSIISGMDLKDTKNVSLTANKNIFNTKEDAIIMTNIFTVIQNIANLNMPFETYLDYLLKRPEINSSVTEIKNMLDTLELECSDDNIYNKIMKPIINEDEITILNEIQYRLYSVLDINDKTDNIYEEE